MHSLIIFITFFFKTYRNKMYLETIFYLLLFLMNTLLAVYANVWKYELSETVSRSLSLCTGVT